MLPIYILILCIICSVCKQSQPSVYWADFSKVVSGSKRSADDAFRRRFYNHCIKVNKQLAELRKTFTNERSGVISERRDKRNFVAFGQLSLSLLNYGMDYDEAEARKLKYYALETSIEIQYNEFLSHTRLANDLQSQLTSSIRVMDSSMSELKRTFNANAKQLNDLAGEVQSAREYGISNRLWVLFLNDIQEINRNLFMFIQKSTEKARINDAITLLRGGLLSEGFVSKSDVLSYIRSRKVNEPYRLAFDEDQIDKYYQYPLVNAFNIGEQTVIELHFRLVKMNAPKSPYIMKKLVNVPFKLKDG